jgi:uncharacterized repeat protein (TIGR03843 family)
VNPHNPSTHDSEESHADSVESEGSRSVTLDSTIEVTDPAVTDLLLHGEIEILGRMPWSSNATLLATVSDELNRTQAIYKPEAGERPLWDFPPGLWRREIATYELAMALGWAIVPPTVRRDGPAGVGSLQFFVPSDFDAHFFTFHEDPRHHTALQQFCLLDVVTNNTDRKGGHLLLDHHDRLWGIDHGMNFHEEFKLRTVIWDFADDPIDRSLAEPLIALLSDGLPDTVCALLSDAEIEATLGRVRALLAAGRFPVDMTGRQYPWPLV